MKQQEITVSIDGGCALDRAGIVALLSSFPGLQVVPLDRTSSPHVLIWDVGKSQLPEHPPVPANTAVLLLIEEADFKTFPQGVSGLFSKDEPPEALGAAIRQVARGEQYLSPSLALAFLKSRQAQISEVQIPALGALTNREREILDLLAAGMSNKTIASRLYLSIRTVEGHLANIYAKLGVHSRTEAMLAAIQNR